MNIIDLLLKLTYKARKIWWWKYTFLMKIKHFKKTDGYFRWSIIWKVVFGGKLELIVAGKNIKKLQSKLPKSLFDLRGNLGLIDFCRQKNRNSGEYTYFSERKKSFSTIDMILLSKDKVTLASKGEILPVFRP